MDEKIQHIRENSNIPKRYIDAKFEPKTQQQEKLCQRLIKEFKDGLNDDTRDFLIYGTIGNGKTYITIGFLNKLIENKIYCRYITEFELLDLYFTKEFNKFKSFKQTPILIIDELGKRSLIDWQMIQIEELMSYRYNEKLPTIYITNLDTEEFKNFVGSRISSRLRDNKVIPFFMDGEDLRGKEF